MRRTAILLFLWIVSFFAMGQQPGSYPPEPVAGNDSNILGISNLYCIGKSALVDQQQWRAYLEKNLVLDDEALDTIPSGRYTVFIQFVVISTGEIEEAEILSDPGFGLGEKARWVISQFTECWEPAKQNGRKVKSYCKQPILFVVEDEEGKRQCDEPLPAEAIL